MAYIHADMKQFELSCVMFQKSIDIWKRTGERDNEKIIKAEKDLAHMLKQALIVHRENIDVGHAFRICNQCEQLVMLWKFVQLAVELGIVVLNVSINIGLYTTTLLCLF